MTTQMFDVAQARPVAGMPSHDMNPIRTAPSQAGNPDRRFYMAVKVSVEWLVALTLFVISSPVMAALAAAVKLTSAGPAFYAQTRLGRNGRLYRIYKLRTMVHNAEAATGPVWAARGDRRITPVGKILRDTHLDELPQLWNVLRGEMGLIGPRPERPEIAARITSRIPEFADRLQVRPGVTGLAQMLLPADDPNDAELEGLRKKLAHDLYYVANVNALMDLRISISTPCYFLAAAVSAMQRKVLSSFGRSVEETYGQYDLPRDEACEQVA